MKFQPAQANRAIETRRVFRRRPFVAEQERAVELLDVDSAILHRLEGVRVLHQIGAPPTTVAAPSRSLWQTACVGMRTLLDCDWLLRRANAVSTITGVTW